MRTFTNKKGEVVTVSKEHLDTAVEIKIQLQKASPSRRCSWAMHVKMMEKEGFNEAENSERYRCLIKSYQESIDRLPSAESHADMVSDNKLESIKEMIGEISYAKRDAQNEFRKLNKVKRDVTDTVILIEEISKSFESIDLDVSELNSYKHISHKTDNSIVVMMTDWHVGVITSNFNYDVAQMRVKKYADRIIHYCKLFDVNEVKVLGLGDLVEGGYMRPQQAFDIEFTYSEQVVKATEIVNSFLIMLAKELNVIYLGSVLGNHSRMYDKGATITGDSSENIVDASVKSFIKMVNHPRISIDDKKIDNFEIVFECSNKVIKGVHGDLMKKSSKNKVSQLILTDNIMYDLLLHGHFHHTSYIEENHNRMTIGAGCLQGSTDYTKHLGYDTVASQTIIVFEGDSVIPIKINLE